MKHNGEWGGIDYDFDHAQFARRVSEAFSRQNASFSAIAADCGIDPHSITNILKRGACSLPTGAKLAYRCGVSLDWLAGLTDQDDNDEIILQRAADILGTTPERLWQLYGADVF